MILREEKYLVATLGPPYLAYKVRVPRFFPDLRLYSDLKEVTFEPRILRQTLLDGIVFFVSIPLFELVEEGQEAGMVPVLFRLY